MPPPYQYIGGALASANTTQLVTKASDLSGTLSSGIAYFIDGSIDMGEQSITVPQGGLVLTGNGTNISVLYSSSDNYTMFVDDGVYSGDLFVTNITLDVTGASSKIFDLDNDGNENAIEFNTVNFGQFANGNTTSMGTLSKYRQLLMLNCGLIKIADGLECVGTWSGGQAIIDSIALSIPANATLFKAGAGFVVGSSVRSNMNALSIDDTAVVFDYAESNFTQDEGFLLDNFRASPSASAVPNISEASTKAKFVNCRGIRNTYPGGDWTISSAAATVLSDTVTLVKLAGTTTYADLQWFSGSASNAIKYESTVEIDIVISGILSFSGTNNNECVIQLRQWDNSASSYINIGPEFVGTLNGGPSGSRGENIPFQGVATLNKDDRIEVWIRNNTAANNITALVGGEIIFSERAS